MNKCLPNKSHITAAQTSGTDSIPSPFSNDMTRKWYPGRLLWKLAGELIPGQKGQRKYETKLIVLIIAREPYKNETYDHLCFFIYIPLLNILLSLPRGDTRYRCSERVCHIMHHRRKLPRCS